MALLEQEEDVNQLTEFFSYEHFYVIYCKFWELDTDHDLYIDQKDLAGHNDQGAQTHPCLFSIISLVNIVFSLCPINMYFVKMHTEDRRGVLSLIRTK